MNDKNAPKAPQFEDSIWNSFGWNSPSNFEQKQVIAFGPYLKDTDDLAAQEYDTTAGLALKDLFRTIILLIIILVAVPIFILIGVIRMLRKQ